MKKRKRERSDRTFVTAVMLGYVVITLVVAWHHEPWRDEANGWLLLRDGGFGTMLARTGYGGMPALWYLLVGVLTTLGLPYFSMTLLNLVVAWAALLIFLVYAPFPRWIRVLFTFSYFMAYEYSVVARPYAISILFLFAVMAIWPRRVEHPLRLSLFVAVLASATTHALIICVFLGLAFLADSIRSGRWKERGVLAAIAIMIVGGLISAFQLIPPEDMPKSHVVRGTNVGNLVWAIGNAFFPVLSTYIWLPFALTLVVIGCVTLAIGTRWIAQIYMWGSLVTLSLLFVFVWMAGLRHAGLLLLVVITALWLSASYEPSRPAWERRTRVALGLSLLYCIAVSAYYWKSDIERPFSGAAEMASFLRANGLDRYEIAAHPPPASESLLPYLPGKRFYYAAMHEHGSYMLWDGTYNLAGNTPYGLAVQAAADNFRGKQWLLLVNEEMKSPERFGFRLLFTNLTPPFEKLDERYWLYAPLDWPGEPIPDFPPPPRS